MKKLFKYLKWVIVSFLSLLFIYALAALILSLISTSPDEHKCNKKYECFVATNGVHLFLIMPIDNISSDMKRGLNIKSDVTYLSNVSRLANSESWIAFVSSTAKRLSNVFRFLVIFSGTLGSFTVVFSGALALMPDFSLVLVITGGSISITGPFGIPGNVSIISVTGLKIRNNENKSDNSEPLAIKALMVFPPIAFFSSFAP